MKTYILIALLLIGCAFLLGASETTRRAQWEFGNLEHRYVNTEIKDMQGHLYAWLGEPPIIVNSAKEFCEKIKHPELTPLNALGMEGWELISIQTTSRQSEIVENYWFKRPK